jgi:beta-xylosidase
MNVATSGKELCVSAFCRGLTGGGRILEGPDYYVWCCSPIIGPDEKVHLFYSRWPASAGFGGWLTCCEIAHAVADAPEGPYETVDVAVAPRGGAWWDAGTCHNPTIHKVGGQYVLFYMGACDGTVYTKRIGMAVSDSLSGPWKRSDQPIIEPDPDPSAWNSMCTTNPAFVQLPDGELRLYYKSWRINDWEYDLIHGDGIRTNRQYGLAVASSIDGPWEKVGDGPMIDLRHIGRNAQSEDAFIWMEGETFKMIMRDMGYWNHEYGLYFESDDGIHWSDPQVAFWDSHRYFNESSNGLDREGRLERPQLLMREGRPDYLFAAFQGGQFDLSSGVVLKIGPPDNGLNLL